MNGVLVYEEWLTPKGNKVWIFGENHEHSVSTKKCSGETFMHFMEVASKDLKPVNVYIEVSYVDTHHSISTAFRPKLAVIPALLKNSNITQIRKKYLDCLYVFENKGLCLLPSNVHLLPSDLRLEKKADGTLGTHEYQTFSHPLKSFYEGDTQEQETVLRLIQDYPPLLYTFITTESSERSELARTFLKSKISASTLKAIIKHMFQYYDKQIGFEELTNREIRLLMLEKGLSNKDYVFAFMTSYGSILTDLYIVLQILGTQGQNSIILTGAYHSGVYSTTLEWLGATLIIKGEASEEKNPLCLNLKKMV